VSAMENTPAALPAPPSTPPSNPTTPPLLQAAARFASAAALLERVETELHAACEALTSACSTTKEAYQTFTIAGLLVLTRTRCANAGSEARALRGNADTVEQMHAALSAPAAGEGGGQ
jgi:hypothetical protein